MSKYRIRKGDFGRGNENWKWWIEKKTWLLGWVNVGRSYFSDGYFNSFEEAEHYLKAIIISKNSVTDVKYYDTK